MFGGVGGLLPQGHAVDGILVELIGDAEDHLGLSGEFPRP